MSGARVIWTIDGEVVKDETVVNDRSSVESVADGGTIAGARVEVEFRFDPPLTRPPSPVGDPLHRAERAIVRALADAGFGPQTQVTGNEGFAICTEEILVEVRVEGQR